MQEDNTVFRASWKQTYFVIAIVMIFYAYLSRPAELALDVEVKGDYAYLAVERGGLRIVDISDPTQPEEISFYDTRGIAKSLAIVGDHAYVADGREGLRVIDISDTSNPREVGYYDTPGVAEDIVVVDQHAYIADGKTGLLILNIKDPTNPKQIPGSVNFKPDGEKNPKILEPSMPRQMLKILSSWRRLLYWQQTNVGWLL
jgi:hypothetical protein